MLGVDSAARFSAAAAKAAGYSVGARYINQSFNKNELADYQANGLILLPIYEESGKPGSFSDGARQGANAKRLLEGLGLAGYGCVFTDDVSNAPLSVCQDWCRGIRSTFPWHLVYYGPTHIIDALGDQKLIDSGWVEGAFSYSAGWHGGVPQARYQCGTQYPKYVTVGGVTCDYNEFYSTPWLPGHSTPGTPANTGDWLDMATKEEVRAELKDLLCNDPDVGSQIAYWVTRARAEGQKQAVDKDLPDLKKLVDEWTKGNDNHDSKSDKLDQIWNATGAHV